MTAMYQVKPFLRRTLKCIGFLVGCVCTILTPPHGFQFSRDKSLLGPGLKHVNLSYTLNRKIMSNFHFRCHSLLIVWALTDDLYGRLSPKSETEYLAHIVHTTTIHNWQLHCSFCFDWRYFDFDKHHFCLDLFKVIWCACSPVSFLIQLLWSR